MSKEFPITISSWTLGDQCKFEDRVIAAKNAGYEGIGLRAETYVDALNEGLFDKDILAILDKHGMKVTEVEYIVQWAEEHRSYEQKYKEQLCFHMCELFNVEQINCGLMENYSVEYTAQKLRELCQRAGKYIIGVDSDQAMLFSGSDEAKANVILSSVLKNVGDSLVRMAEMEEEGTVPYGKCEFLGLKENGAGLADNEYFQKNVPDEIKKTIEEKKQEVLDGKIEIPTALGDADQNEVQALIASVAP